MTDQLSDDAIDRLIAEHCDPVATYRGLHRFARALIAQEREACAKVCETMPEIIRGGSPGSYFKRSPLPCDCAAAIRGTKETANG